MKIYSKGGILLAEVNDTSYSGAFMGERFVSCTVKSAVPIQFLPGDYIDYRGERFVLDYTPTDKKTSSVGSVGDAFQYDLKFVSLKHELEKCLFLDVVLNDNEVHYTGLSDVQVFGDAKVLADRILANLNRLYKGEDQWKIQVLQETVSQNISLSDSNCWDAVALFKSLFDLNFTVYGREIKVGTAGKKVEHVFQYGSGNGLTEIVRTAVTGEAVVTRLKAFGGNRNLPRDYNKKGLVPKSQYIPNLMLPGYTETLIDYIDSDNISIYGIREAVFKNEEIYPSIAGVTADDLKAAGVKTQATGRIDEIVYMEPIKRDDQATFNVWIKDIGFNIKDYLTPATALISIRDGNLGGYEFEITNVIRDSSVEGAAYRLTLNRNQDDNFILPDEKTFIKPGDHFVLLEIYMPEVYVKAAEQRLLAKAQDYLAEYDHVKATYSINMDKVFMANNPTLGDVMYEGDVIEIIDDDLKLDREIIVQNLTIKNSGTVPEYTVTLSDDPVATTLNRVQDNISEIEQTITANKVDGVKEARRRAIELQLLKSNIFDPDGEIKDTFLQTMMLQVGANSMNYQMGKTTARPNLVNMSYTNTTINLGADDVIHFAYGAGEEKASTWHITTPFAGSGLDEAKTYFVAIKASRDNLNAEWIVDENTYGAESIPGYYVFNFGILSEVTDGERYFSETRGNIYAYGDELSAGVISSIDRYSWFNLNTGEFQLYNKASGDGLSFKNGKLTLGGNFNPATGEFGSTIQGIENTINQQQENVEKIDKDFAEYKETTNQNLETIHTVTDDLQSQIDGNIMAWDGDYVPTLSNFPASEWKTDEEKSRHKGDYFDRTFIQNDKKVTERYKFILDNGVYQWLPIADSSSALALQEAREALGLAGSKAKLFYGDTIPTAPYDINDAWVKLNGTILLSNSKRAEGYGQNETDWKVVNDTQVRLAQMSSDGVISKEEKASLRNEKSQIDKEYQKYVQDAASYEVSITDLQAAYNSLVDFLTNTIRINEDSDFTFSGLEQQNQYNQYFANYYATRTSFANIIANKITETGIGNLQIGGVNLLNQDVTYDNGDFYIAAGISNLEIGKQYIVHGNSKFAAIRFNGVGSFIFNNIFTIPENYIYVDILFEKNIPLSELRVKLEEGNKPTAWSPSLFDQKSQTEAIAQAKAEVERTKAEAYADGIVTEAEQNAIDEAQRRLDALQIGGVNLVSGTGTFTKDVVPKNGGFGQKQSTTFKNNVVYQTTSDWQGIAFNIDPTHESTIISIWARKISGSPGYSDYVNRNRRVTIDSGEWKQYYIEYPNGATFNHSSASGLIEFNGGIVQYSSPKVELATKPSDWTPSIEDTQNDINYGKLFLRGTGFKNNADRYAILNNDSINIAAPGRGLNLITINRNTLKVIDNLIFDIYGSIPDVTNLVNKLNSLSSDVIVTLTSFDEASGNWTSVLTGAIERCGGFGIKPELWYPYAFVGIPGIGKGNGIEVITTAEANAPYAEISTQIISGIPIGVTVGKSTVAFEAQQKANEAIGKADNATANSAQAIQDAANAQSNANAAIQDAQNAANKASEAEKKAAEAASDAVKAYNEAKEALTKAQNLDYLNAAFGDISTELSKGVVLSGVIAAKDRNGSVVAGLAGTIPQGQSNYPMIFAGAANAVSANNAKVAIYGDGSGWLAGKSISWDAAGNATFTGKITSSSSDAEGMVVINPDKKSIDLMKGGHVSGSWNFNRNGGSTLTITDITTGSSIIEGGIIDLRNRGAERVLHITPGYSIGGLASGDLSTKYLNIKFDVGANNEFRINGLKYFRTIPDQTDRWATLLIHRGTGIIAMSETPD